MARAVHFENDSNLLLSSQIAMRIATEKKCSSPTFGIDDGSNRSISGSRHASYTSIRYKYFILNNWVVRVLQFGSVPTKSIR